MYVGISHERDVEVTICLLSIYRNLKKARAVKRSRYQRQLERIRSKNGSSENIEKAVSAAIKNVFDDKCRSFVIYGEPQSGKTEMMIALTAALLDHQAKIIILLLNDSVQLLTQTWSGFVARISIQPQRISRGS